MAWWGALILVAAAAAWRASCRVAGSAGRSHAGARFAGRRDLRRFLRSRRAWVPLGYARHGRICGLLRPGRLPAALRRLVSGPLLRLPDEALERHLLVVGLTGAGKTTAVTMPVLLDAARQPISVVAFDLKYGEDDSLARAVPAWQQAGRDVWIFAPLDVGSMCWNPLEGCHAMSAAQRVATMLFDEPREGESDLAYWVGAERHVCATLVLAIARDGGPVTLERLRSLCAAGPEAVRAYVRTHAHADALDRCLGAYRAMLPKDEAGILQGIASRLEAWSDPAVCRATGEAPPGRRLDLDLLRREPTFLVVGIPQSVLDPCRWLWRLFLRDLGSRLLRPRAPSEPVRVLEVIEELPAWGPLPGLAEQLATLRSRKVSVLVTIQSEAQGEHVYGRAGWAAVCANLVTKLYLAPLADSDADRLSRMLGLTTAHDVSRSLTSTGLRDAEYHREIAVPLCPPEKLQGIDTDPHEILVRCAGLPPARLWCPPFYARPEYHGLAPAHPPATAEITVYHDLWTRHRGTGCMWKGTTRSLPFRDASVPQPLGPAAPSLEPDETPASRPSAPNEGPGPCPSAPPAASPVGPARISGIGGPHQAPGTSSSVHPSGPPLPEPAPEDLEGLRKFVEAALMASSDGTRPGVRAVWRAGRLVALHIDSVAATRLCGGSRAMQGRVRRWAELGWVRRARPVLMLERRAIEAASGAWNPVGCRPSAPAGSWPASRRRRPARE